MVTHRGKFKTLRDLVAAAKAAKDPVNYATNGYGSASHFTTERFGSPPPASRRSR